MSCQLSHSFKVTISSLFLIASWIFIYIIYNNLLSPNIDLNYIKTGMCKVVNISGKCGYYSSGEIRFYDDERKTWSSYVKLDEPHIDIYQSCNDLNNTFIYDYYFKYDNLRLYYDFDFNNLKLNRKVKCKVDNNGLVYGNNNEIKIKTMYDKMKRRNLFFLLLMIFLLLISYHYCYYYTYYPLLFGIIIATVVFIIIVNIII